MEPEGITTALKKARHKRKIGSLLQGCERKMHFPVCNPKAELLNTTFNCPPVYKSLGAPQGLKDSWTVVSCVLQNATLQQAQHSTQQTGTC